MNSWDVVLLVPCKIAEPYPRRFIICFPSFLGVLEPVLCHPFINQLLSHEGTAQSLDLFNRLQSAEVPLNPLAKIVGWREPASWSTINSRIRWTPRTVFARAQVLAIFPDVLVTIPAVSVRAGDGLVRDGLLVMSTHQF